MRAYVVFLTSFLILTPLSVNTQSAFDGSVAVADEYTYDLYDPEGEEGDYFSTNPEGKPF